MNMDWLKTRGLRIGLFGAFLASVGDVLLLLVSNGDVPLPSAASSNLLLIGALFGVAGIALYQFGYRARAEQIRGEHPRAAAWLALGGGMFAATGAAVHGATALAIAANGGASPPANPYEGILQSGVVLISLWGLGAVFFFMAALADLFGASAWKQRLFNPLIATLAIVAVSLFLPAAWGNIIGPASINFAHLIFFGRYVR